MSSKPGQERPPVSVVMPFAGTAAEGAEAVAALSALAVGERDERILVDNGGTLSDPGVPGIRLVRASEERSPAHARNVGAAHARNDWILFVDADCRLPVDLIDLYFAAAPESDVGALAGAVTPAPGAPTFAARYGAARSFLDQGAHLAHPYLPRAVAANLLVRREAFAALGGFLEGVRAAEDTDFSWRLQRAGWRLVARPEACVEHVYRESLRALRAQWRGYAAGRAWLGRRYDDFSPEPAVRRAARRALHRPRGAGSVPTGATSPRTATATRDGSRLTRAGFAAVDALLGVEELVGFALSNRPAAQAAAPAPARVVLVADRYPAPDDPLTELAATLAGARVEAAARPEAIAPAAPGAPPVRYREDDGEAARRLALLGLLARHPLRCLRDAGGRIGGSGTPPLRELAPVVKRLGHDGTAPIRPLGGGAAGVARRLARLSGRRLDD